MRSVEAFLVDPMASLDLPVMLRGPGANELVQDPLPLAKGIQKARPFLRVFRARLRERLVRELGPVVGLEGFGRVAEEGDGRGERADGLEHGMLVGEPKEAFPARLVQDGVLVIGFVAWERRGLAFGRHELDVHLPLVARERGRVVFLVMPFRVGFVRFVSIEPLDVPEDGGIRRREARRDRLDPNVDGAPIVSPRLAEEAFDLVGGLL